MDIADESPDQLVSAPRLPIGVLVLDLEDVRRMPAGIVQGIAESRFMDIEDVAMRQPCLQQRVLVVFRHLERGAAFGDGEVHHPHYLQPEVSRAWIDGLNYQAES